MFPEQAALQLLLRDNLGQAQAPPPTPQSSCPGCCRCCCCYCRGRSRTSGRSAAARWPWGRSLCLREERGRGQERTKTKDGKKDGRLRSAQPRAPGLESTLQSPRRSAERALRFHARPGSTSRPWRDSLSSLLCVLVSSASASGPSSSALPLADVLAAGAILVLVGRDAQLMAQEATSLHAGQSWSHRVSPLRNKDDEGQRLRGLVQELLTGTRKQSD